MLKALRYFYLALAWLFLAGVVSQVFLAGLFLFGSYTLRATHAAFGFNLGLVPLLMLILSFLIRVPRRMIGLTALLFGVYILQTLLPGLRQYSAYVAALHPVNALALFWVTLVVARKATALARESSGTEASVVP